MLSAKSTCNLTRLTVLSLLSALTIGLIGSKSLAADPDARPNFVLCMTDDQGWGDVGYYGHPKLKTPVLDEMARTGLRFDRFYSASSVCSPTRGSLLTGRNPNRFGCYAWGHPIRAQEVTIAEVLKKAGYATGHFGKWHLGQVLEGAENSPGGSGFETWLSAPNFFENNPLLSKNGTVIQTEGESSDVPVTAALDFIAAAKKDQKPFLAVIWFGNPHGPHQAWPEIKKLYPDLPPAEQNYYAEITGVDQAMGKLRTSLREMGLAENTVLWFNSDNGPQGGGRGMGSAGDFRGRKATLFEGGIRVPGIIEWPSKITQPRITEVAASTMDIYPTVLALAGAKAEEQPILDGEDLSGVIAGTETSRKTPIGFWDYPIRGIGMPSDKMLAAIKAKQEAGEEVKPATVGPIKPLPLDNLPGHAAWMEGDWKLHKVNKGDESIMLYNLATDPQESKDLASAEPERVKQMLSALTAWQKSVIRSHNGEDYK